jgi:hypothetical protein
MRGGNHGLGRKPSRSNGTALAVTLSVAAVGIVPAVALGVVGDFSQPPTSPETTGDAPTALAAGDFGGGAGRDLAVANFSSDTVTILLGNGSGDFTPAGTSPETVGSDPRTVAVADLGGDANADLAVANQGEDTVTILLGDGTGNFTEVATTSPEAVGDGPTSIAAVNLGGDPNTDLAVANEGDDEVTILLGDGSGDFTEVAATSPEAVGDSPRSIAAADFDGVGGPDLAVANLDTDDVTILLGDGSGDFTETAATSPEDVGDLPVSVAAGDLGGDASIDLAVVNQFSGNATILLGDGTGDFTAAGTSPEALGAGASPRSVAAVDLNGDASADLAIADGITDNAKILLGDGSGDFTAAATSPEPAGDLPASIVATNLGGGANPDLAIANEFSDNVTILINDYVAPIIPAAVNPPAKRKCKKGRKLKKGKCVKKKRKKRKK